MWPAFFAGLSDAGFDAVPQDVALELREDGEHPGQRQHVSPIEWDNVVLYGQYVLDRKLIRRSRGRS